MADTSTILPFKNKKPPGSIAPALIKAVTEASSNEGSEDVQEIPIRTQRLIEDLLFVIQYITENQPKIDHFLFQVAENAPTEDDPTYKEYMLVTSPMSLADLAFAIKRLDSTFHERLTSLKETPND